MGIRKNLGRLAAGAACTVVALGAGGAAADAAAGGYGGGAPGAPGATGAFQTVVAVQAVGGSGGTVTATVGGAPVSVSVPAGDFSGPVQVVFTAGTLTSLPSLPSRGPAVLAFGVQFDQNSAKLAGPFPHPVTLVISDSRIAAGDAVYIDTGTALTPAPGWTTEAGRATGTITEDPDFVVTAAVAGTATGTATGTVGGSATGATTGSAIPGATSAVTGEPFRAEELLAAGLLGVALVGAWRWRRQFRRAV